MADDKVEVTLVQDYAQPSRDGRTVERGKQVEFFIGKHGPFRERFPESVDFTLEFNTRVEKLKQQLALIGS